MCKSQSIGFLGFISYALPGHIMWMGFMAPSTREESIYFDYFFSFLFFLFSCSIALDFSIRSLLKTKRLFNPILSLIYICHIISQSVSTLKSTTNANI